MISANESFGNVLRLACSSYFVSGQAPICVHQNAIRNDLVSTFFLLVDSRELQAAATFFRDFFAFGSWHQHFAPVSVVEAFNQKHNDRMWNAFYKEFCVNAHCPRVQLVCYAMQCALNTGPVLRAQSSKIHTSSREIFFAGKLTSTYNKNGFEKCVRPRTIHAAAMAKGCFDQKSLHIMAIRVFKVLQETKFKNSFACCCSGIDDTTPHSATHVLRCRGPSLDLSNDVGQDHVWMSSPLRKDSWAVDNRSTLRKWQETIRQDLSNAKFVFNANDHVTVPHF